MIHAALSRTIESILGELETVPAERKPTLERLAAFVEATPDPALTFICTHNSRRSHMAQLWAAAAAHHFGIEGVSTHSGGTEVTAFDRRAVAAMRRAGFEIDAPLGANPHYRVTLGPNLPAIECYSKTYDDPANPREGFAAVMTCSQADDSCPLVLGALRISLPYADPKLADGTAQESVVYDRRARQIGHEMLYVFARVAR